MGRRAGFSISTVGKTLRRRLIKLGGTCIFSLFGVKYGDFAKDRAVLFASV